MGDEYPRFGVNFKVYPETIGAKGLDIARTMEQVQDETGATFSLTPQLPDLRMVASETDLRVSAPYCDAIEPGRGMGRILLETLADAGAEGVTINHVENPDTLNDIAFKIRRCRELGLSSGVLVDSVEMGRAVAQLDPDGMTFEVPGDIAGDVAVTRSRPEPIQEFLEMVQEENPDIRVGTGGGVKTAEDVRAAYELGLDSTGAASGIALAENRYDRLREIGEVVAEYQKKRG